MRRAQRDLDRAEAAVREVVEQRDAEEREAREEELDFARDMAERSQEILADHAPRISRDVKRLQGAYKSHLRSPGWRRIREAQAALEGWRPEEVTLPRLYVSVWDGRAGFLDEGVKGQPLTYYQWTLARALTLWEIRILKYLSDSVEAVGTFRQFRDLARLRTCRKIVKGAGCFHLTAAENRRWIQAKARAALVLCTVRLLEALEDKSLPRRIAVEIRGDADARARARKGLGRSSRRKG